MKILEACASLERIQARFEKVKALIKGAVEEGKVQQLKHYLIQLNVLLKRSEALRTQFIMGASLELPYYIDDEIRYCKGMLKTWQ
jgi:hypothetical protein